MFFFTLAIEIQIKNNFVLFLEIYKFKRKKKEDKKKKKKKKKKPFRSALYCLNTGRNLSLRLSDYVGTKKKRKISSDLKQVVHT